MWGKQWFQRIGHDYTAHIDDMDFDVWFPRKAFKLNHSLPAYGMLILFTNT